MVRLDEIKIQKVWQHASPPKKRNEKEKSEHIFSVSPLKKKNSFYQCTCSLNRFRKTRKWQSCHWCTNKECILDSVKALASQLEFKETLCVSFSLKNPCVPVWLILFPPVPPFFALLGSVWLPPPPPPLSVSLSVSWMQRRAAGCFRTLQWNPVATNAHFDCTLSKRKWPRH